MYGSWLNCSWNYKCFGKSNKGHQKHVLSFVNFPRKSCGVCDNCEYNVESDRVQWLCMLGNSVFILFTAFPHQKVLHERATLLRYIYRECSVPCCVRLLCAVTCSVYRVFWRSLFIYTCLCTKGFINSIIVNRLEIC